MTISKRTRKLQAALKRSKEQWDAISYPFEVINKATRKSHGAYSTLEEAIGCTLFDKLDAYEIWERSEQIVEEQDGPEPAR